jgi:hypothetical protein
MDKRQARTKTNFVVVALGIVHCTGKRGEISSIFGPSDERSYAEYTVAWAILYHRFKTDGVTKDAAQQALKEIHAVVSDKFLYRRWSDSGCEYRFYPRKTDKYQITNVSKPKR